MLATFLNRTLLHPTLGQDRVFRRLGSGRLAKRASRSGSVGSCAGARSGFLGASVTGGVTNKFSSHLGGSMEKINRRLMKRWHDAASDWGEMGT
jgi:hypothetical protein